MSLGPFQSLVLVCDSAAATQQISFLRPLVGHMEVRVLPSAAVDGWISQAPAIPDASCVAVSRVTGQAGERIAEWARRRKFPVVYHIDDDLLGAPMSLGQAKFRHYSEPSRIAQLRRNMEAAHLVYASTEPLGARLAAHGVSRPILTGEIYCSIDPGDILPPLPATAPLFGYMGTAGHAEDLEMIVPAIELVLHALPTAEFEVFGTIQMPISLERFAPRIRYLPGVADYACFLRRMHSLGWWVGLAPIADNAFNRCKADTKWLEYTLAGMAVVASNLPVYRRACDAGSGALVNDVASWANAISSLLAEPDRRRSMIGRAQSRLRDDYSHAALREQLLAVFLRAHEIAAASWDEIG